MLDTSNMIARDPLLNGFTYDELKVGHTAFFCKTVSESDIYTFAGITGDFNPAHVNQTVAEKMVTGSRIGHGAFTAGLISAALGTKMPGQGCLYIAQNTKFIRPARFGDTLTVRLEVVEKNDAKKRVTIKTEVFNQNDELIAKGEADILPKT